MPSNSTVDANPSGPDAAGPPSLRREVLGVEISMALLATLAVGIYMYTRFGIVKNSRAEDCKRNYFTSGAQRNV